MKFQIEKLITFLCVTTLWTSLVRAQTPQEYKFEYAAKIVGGNQNESNNLRLAKGRYATTVNIHNPNDSTAFFYKKVALTYPPEEQLAGKIVPLGVDTLSYNEALKVDCIDIRKHFNFPTYIEGFVVIQSTVSLDVSAVYTTARPTRFLFWASYKVASIDVEQIHERKISALQPPEVPEELDHFKVYEVDPAGGALDLTVFLKGQFDDDEAKEVRLGNIRYFANPTSKVHRGFRTAIKDSNRHLNWYELKQPQSEPRRTVRFRNQFGQHSVDIKDPKFLLVPAQKTSDPGSVFPDSLDHYKCYEVISINTMPHLPSVKLRDQFCSKGVFCSDDSVGVLKPRFFCVPVSKYLPGEPQDEDRLVNRDDHLAIYDITPEQDQLRIKVKDQFDEHELVVFRSVILAVPSKKQVVATHPN